MSRGETAFSVNASFIPGNKMPKSGFTLHELDDYTEGAGREIAILCPIKLVLESPWGKSLEDEDHTRHSLMDGVFRQTIEQNDIERTGPATGYFAAKIPKNTEALMLTKNQICVLRIQDAEVAVNATNAGECDEYTVCVHDFSVNKSNKAGWLWIYEYSTLR